MRRGWLIRLAVSVVAALLLSLMGPVPVHADEPTAGRTLGLAPNYLGPRATQLGDINGDGRADVFSYRAGDFAWLVSYSGTSAYQVVNYGRLDPNSTWLADLNGDGRADVFSYRQSDQAWLVSYSAMSAWVVINHGYLNPDLTRFGDVTGDGIDDVFTQLPDGHWARSDGGTGPWVTINGGGFQPTTTWVGDLNGDGVDDVVAVNANQSWVVSYGGTGAWKTINNGYLDPTATQLIDMNGDGKADIYTVNSAGQWLVSYSGTSAWQTINNGYLDPTRTWLADMNGDHVADVFTIQNYLTQWAVSYSATGPWTVINHGYLPADSPVITYPDPSDTPGVPVNAVTGGQTTTQRYVALQADPSGGGPWVRYESRVGATDNFTVLPIGDVKDADGVARTAPWPDQRTGSPASFTAYTWDVRSTLTPFGLADTNVLVQVRACYGATQSDPSPACSKPNTITYSPNGFDAALATDDIGPGTLALGSGDYEVGESDADAATALGGLSIGRTLTTKAPAAAVDTGAGVAAGVFGPGWTAALSGPDDTGVADMRVEDHSKDGYMVLVDTDGTAWTYRATGPVAPGVTFVGVGDAAGDGLTLTLVSATELQVADSDQTVTTYQGTASGATTTWQVSSVAQAGTASKTTTSYAYDGAGRVTRIIAPSEAGCTNTNADTTPGCRSLKLAYATPSGAPAGTLRLTTVSLSVPQGSGTNVIPVAQYSYDASGWLTQAWDPRLPGLKTSYTYTSVPQGQTGAGRPRLSTIAQPGVAPWTLDYDSAGRVTKVSRQVPVTDSSTGAATTKTATTTVVYGLPTSGAGLPPMTRQSVETWGQTPLAGTGTGGLPVDGDGVAIFGPDHTPTTTDPAAMPGGEWASADLHYLDVNGREVNTAVFGDSDGNPATAGEWLIDSTRYDAMGNVVWQLSAGNRYQALTPTAATDPYVADIPDAAARADLLAATTVYSTQDPTLVTDTYGPTHPITLSDGTVVDGRAHTHTDYDQGAPNGDVNVFTNAPFRLPTTVTSTVRNVVTGQDSSFPDAHVTRLGYDGYVAFLLNGWMIGHATTSTVQAGATASSEDQVTTTTYDDSGRVLQVRLPHGNGTTGGASAGTSSPRTTVMRYYTTTGTGVCAQAKWAGLLCQTAPGGQPSSGSPLPTTTYTYDAFGQPVETTQLFGTSSDTDPSRHAVVTYDSAERPVTSTVTVKNGPGDNAVLPTVTTSYDPKTGQVASKTTGAGTDAKTLTTTYDSVGEVSTYTDATGNVTTTGYDIDGRPVRQSDSRGAVTLGYDGGDEHRGLVTSEDIGAASDSTFAAAYDASGNLTETYPGGLTASSVSDNAGNRTKLTYTKAGNTLLAFTQAVGVANTGSDHVVAQSSKVNGAAYSNQTFADDAFGRLTTVTDTYNGSCTTRQYGFNPDSDRTSLKSYPAASGGACSTSTAATAIGYTYDDADRLTSDTTGGVTNAYSYDVFGRTPALPGADAVGIGSHHAAAGDMTLGYYSNDMVASQAQGSGEDATTIAFGLDPDQDRVLTEATTTAAGTKTLTNHYDDASDETAWTSTLKTDGTTVTKRYVDGIDGSLAATVADDGTVRLELTNLHGDTVATIDPTATSIGSYHETTEYGLPRDAASAADDYGWLGGKKRSSDDLGGLTLMGVRLYSPATGRFLSVDPVPGGNANAYTYPTDPINDYDTTGATTVPVGGGGGCHCAHNGEQKLSGIQGYYTSGWTTIEPGAGVAHDLIAGITGYGTLSAVTLDKVQVRRRTERHTLYTCKHHVWEAESVTLHVSIQYRAYYSVAWVFHRHHTFGWEKVF